MIQVLFLFLDDYSVPDEVGPRVAPKKKADIRGM